MTQRHRDTEENMQGFLRVSVSLYPEEGNGAVA